MAKRKISDGKMALAILFPIYAIPMLILSMILALIAAALESWPDDIKTLRDEFHGWLDWWRKS